MHRPRLLVWTAALAMGFVVPTASLLADSHPPVSGESAAAPSGAAHGEHAKAAEPNILSGDLGNVVWTLIIFFVLLILLGSLAWKPILKALQSREQFITESLAAAKRERMESERMMREYTAQMNKAREDATAIVEEGRRDAEALRRKIHEDAKKEAADMLVRAQREIKIAKDTAVADLYQQVVEVSTNLAGRIARKQLNAADHRGLLDESLAELGKLKN